MLMFLAASPGQAQQPFYIGAHMTNTPKLVDWGLAQGANAVEADLNFQANGTPVNFRHGGICECPCSGAPLCKVESGSTCAASTPAKQLLNHIAAKKEISLFVLDSKMDDDIDQSRAGAAVINLLDSELFGKGFAGKAIVGVGSSSYRRYIAAATKQAAASPNVARIYFSFDEETKIEPELVLEILKKMTKNASYGYGISACFTRSVVPNIKEAVALRPQVGGITYAWTYDKPASMRELIDIGALGIITNDPASLVNIVRSERRDKVRPALPSDPFPQGRD